MPKTNKNYGFYWFIGLIGFIGLLVLSGFGVAGWLGGWLLAGWLARPFVRIRIVLLYYMITIVQCHNITALH